MSNKDLLEAELKVQYGLMLEEEKSVQEAVLEAVYIVTGEELTQDELDVFEDYDETGAFQDFIDWVLKKIDEFIEWLKDWWNEED